MIHRDITPRGVGFVRFWVFGLWAVYLLGNDPRNYARIPDVEFDPPGILRLLPEGFTDALMTTGGLGLLKWVTLLGVLACMLGVRPWRAIAIPTVLLLTLHQGVPRGLFGYVNHKELGALYAAWVLAAWPATAFSPFAGRRKRVDSPVDESTRAATERTLMLVLMAVLLVPYCLVGLYRLTHSDFSLWSSDTFAHYMIQTSYGTSWFDNAELSEQVLARPFLLQLLAISFPIGTIAEVLAPLCIVNRRFRLGWIASMVGLHLLTWATMDILFWENLALYPVLLVDNEFLLRKFDALRARISKPSETEAPSSVESERAVGVASV